MVNLFKTKCAQILYGCTEGVRNNIPMQWQAVTADLLSTYAGTHELNFKDEENKKYALIYCSLQPAKLTRHSGVQCSFESQQKNLNFQELQLPRARGSPFDILPKFGDMVLTLAYSALCLNDSWLVIKTFAVCRKVLATCAAW